MVDYVDADKFADVIKHAGVVKCSDVFTYANAVKYARVVQYVDVVEFANLVSKPMWLRTISESTSHHYNRSKTLAKTSCVSLIERICSNDGRNISL